MKRPFFTGVRIRLMNYLKEMFAPENLEGIRLSVFGGSMRDHVAYLRNQNQGK